MGDPYLLPAIAAVVLGGTSILGGRGNYLGTVAGVILITLLQSILSVMQMRGVRPPRDLRRRHHRDAAGLRPRPAPFGLMRRRRTRHGPRTHHPASRSIDPRFRQLALPYIHVEKLYTGCRWAEGPAWFAAGRYLVWSDIPNDRMLRWDETDGSVSVFRQPALNSNGHTVDLRGPARLVRAPRPLRLAHRARRLAHRARLALRRQALQLAERRGRQVRRQRLVQRPELRHRQRLRRRRGAERDRRAAASIASTPAAARSRVVASDFVQPNGLAFSPDESLLYIVDTGATHVADGPHHVRRFQVGGRRRARRRRGLRHLPGRPVRRPARRRPRQPLAERRRRRALPRARRRRCSARCWSRSRSPTCASAAPSATACSSAARRRCTRSTSTRAACASRGRRRRPARSGRACRSSRWASRTRRASPARRRRRPRGRDARARPASSGRRSR